jgi:riboflavin synthase
MFTGIVEETGVVATLTTSEDGIRVGIESALTPHLLPGASLAVNGVCLTAVLVDEGRVLADIGPETARITTLGSLQQGQNVNLERPMRMDGRLDGHFVLGHVDGVGTVTDLRPEGDSHWLTVEFPTALGPFFIRKGSVAVDGISLTIASLGERHFDVQVIPYTWSHTALRHLRPGDKVNLECDMIGKYVVRALEARNS